MPDRVAFDTLSTELGEVKTYLYACAGEIKVEFKKNQIMYSQTRGWQLGTALAMVPPDHIGNQHTRKLAIDPLAPTFPHFVTSLGLY